MTGQPAQAAWQSHRDNRDLDNEAASQYPRELGESRAWARF